MFMGGASRRGCRTGVAASSRLCPARARSGQGVCLEPAAPPRPVRRRSLNAAVRIAYELGAADMRAGVPTRSGPSLRRHGTSSPFRFAWRTLSRTSARASIDMPTGRRSRPALHRPEPARLRRAPAASRRGLSWRERVEPAIVTSGERLHRFAGARQLAVVARLEDSAFTSARRGGLGFARRAPLAAAANVAAMIESGD